MTEDRQCVFTLVGELRRDQRSDLQALPSQLQAPFGGWFCQSFQGYYLHGNLLVGTIV